nr:RHS repeat-associated core domain-containing protein [Bacillus pacificus]
GTTPGAKKLVRDWNKEVGYQKYHARLVVKNVKNRQQVLNWERNNASKVRKAKQPMNRHERP